MVKVIEFRDVHELNKYLDNEKHLPQFEIKVVPRQFENPSTKLLTNCLTYVLILNY